MKFILGNSQSFFGKTKKTFVLEKGQSLNDALHHEIFLPKKYFIIFRVRRIRSSENFHKHRRVFELPSGVPVVRSATQKSEAARENPAMVQSD